MTHKNSKRTASLHNELGTHLRSAVPVVLGVATLFVLQVACFQVDDGPSQAPTSALTSAETGRRAVPASPPTGASAHAWTHTLDEADIPETHRRTTTCDDAGDGGWVWTQYGERGDVQKARLAYSGAGGHDSWSYDFYFEDDDPAVLRHRVEDWSWISGRQDGVTNDTVMERVYTVDEGEVETCRTATLTAPSNVIEDALADAAHDPFPCADAGRVLALAEQADDTRNTGWLQEVCRAEDPSPELLRSMRDHRDDHARLRRD